MGVYTPNIKRPHCCRMCPNPVCIPDGINTMDMLDFIMKRRREHPDRRADDCPLEEIDLVRCSECMYWHEHEWYNTCDKHIGHGFPYNYFCGDGERRTDEQKY